MQPQIDSEKRRFTRFKVCEGVFAHLNSEGSMIGEVMNVSEGGLAFKYLNDLSLPPKHSTLNVFTLGGKFFLRDLPVKTISNTEMHREMDFSSIRMRRAGMAFGAVTESQRNALRRLILEKKAN